MTITPDLIAVAFLILFAAIQLFYYSFFFLRLSLYNKKREPEFHKIPVSIIICAFNEEANLKKNIRYWLEQDYGSGDRIYFEVVVVNDNSEDDSFYFLNTLKEEYPHLHIVNLTQEAKLISGKKFPLSMGIKSARYEHLLLTDADCVPSSNQWLKHMADRFQNGNQIVLGYAPYVKKEGWLNKCIRFETFHSAWQYLSYALAKQPYMGVGRNLAYVKTLFNQNKGFSSHHHILSGDDDLFINQVATSKNTAIQINPEAFAVSEPKKTLEEWHYQKKRHLSTGKYYRLKHRLLLGIYAVSHFLFWMCLIPAFLFHHHILITLMVFCSRWLILFLLQQSAMRKLKEQDLIPFIFVFDLWWLWYNLRSIPSIFFKQKIHWK